MLVYCGTNQIELAITRATKLARIACKPVLWQALRRGVAASMEHLRVPISSPGTVIDVGASAGQFALLARTRWPTAKIVSFEPLAAARARYARVLFETELRPCALGAVAGTAKMHISAQDDSSSLLSIGGRQTEVFPGTEEIAAVDVQVLRLDDAVNPGWPAPWLLKIDVQGFELEVLRGSAGILALVAEVYVECSFLELYEGQALADEVIAFLLPAGLRLAGVFNIARHHGEAIQADLLFRRVQCER